MPANIEVKARTSAFDRQMLIARSLSDHPAEILHQEDTFFHIPRGRLKLRLFNAGGGGGGELIYYDRPDAAGVRASEYLLARTAESTALKAVLAAAFGIAGVVKKKRHLFRRGPIRIHLDEVEGLGQFIEFEYVLREGEDRLAAEAAVRNLLEDFSVSAEEVVAGAYVDLINAGAA